MNPETETYSPPPPHPLTPTIFVCVSLSADDLCETDCLWIDGQMMENIRSLCLHGHIFIHVSSYDCGHRSDLLSDSLGNMEDLMS